MFDNTFSKLKDDGIYIIEDIYFKDKNKFIEYFQQKNILFSLIDIYHENNIANNGVIIIKKMKIFDCIIFNNENLLTKIRLNTLNNYVDYFVIFTWVEKNFKFNIFRKSLETK